MDIGNVMAECQEIGCKFLRIAYLHVYLQKNMDIDWSQTKKTQAGIWWREAVNEEDEISTRIKTIEKDLEISRLMWRKQKNSTTDQDRWYNFVSTVYSPIPSSVVYLFDSRYPATTGAWNMNTLAHEVLSVFSSTVHLVTFSQAWLSVDAPSVQCPTKAYPTKKFSGSYWCVSCCVSPSQINIA